MHHVMDILAGFLIGAGACWTYLDIRMLRRGESLREFLKIRKDNETG